MFLKETNKKIVILSKTGLNIESLYKNWMEVVIFSCVVPLRKESIRSYLLILFSKSKSNNTNEFSASKLTLMSLRNEKN